jgi:glycosyltransferase involved in cell wall biosynthesis
MNINVSVVIPTFNRADLISETINSIIDQSFPPAEIIVVDDGSVDDTEHVIAGYGDKVQYVKIKNSGVCKARNVGVSVANSDWIAFCDADDLWLRDKLSLQVELIRQTPEVEYCFTNFRIVEDGQWSQKEKFDELPPDYWDIPRMEITPNSFVIRESFYHRIITKQPIFPSTIMMTKGFFYNIGGFNESFGRVLSEDFEFTLRCTQEHPIGVIIKPVVGIRRHERNFSKGEMPGVSFVMADIDILNYSMKNHRLGLQHRSMIRDQIIGRSIDAAHGAFAYGNFKIVKEVLKNIPIRRRPPKLWIKATVSRLPSPTVKVFQRILTILRGSNL